MWFEAKPGVIDTQPLSARHNDKRHSANEEKNTGAQTEILPEST